MLIFHHNDHDGRCAAAIALRWAKTSVPRSERGEVKCVELDYAMCAQDPQGAVLSHLEGREHKLVVIVDFSFTPDLFEKVRALTERVIWCDHHRTCKDYPYAKEDIEGLRDFNDKGLSGCELTWKFFFPSKPVPQGVELVGDYDSWRLQRTPDCFWLYEGLKTFDTLPESKTWINVMSGAINHILDAGVVSVKYLDNYCARMLEAYGHETTIGGHKALAVNLYGFGSGAFGAKFKEYPVCVAYIFDGATYTVSLYSETVDVSEIAKIYGGGGHRGRGRGRGRGRKGAAGFVCRILPFVTGD